MLAYLLLLSAFLLGVKEMLRSQGFPASLWPWPSFRDFDHLNKLIHREPDLLRRRRFWWLRVAVYAGIASFAIVPLILDLLLR
jgi:hypothetical protein